MGLTLGDARSLTLPRAPVVVGIPAYGAFPRLRALLLSLERTMPADVPVLVVDDAHPGGSVLAACGDLLRGSRLDLHLLVNPTNIGFVASCNRIFDIAGEADVIVCNTDVEVFDGWFEGMCAAGRSSTLVASASALGTNASVLSVPVPGLGEPPPTGADDLAAAAARVRAEHAWHPELPTAIGHLMYITRRALSVVGPFDERFSPGYGEEVQWSQRALAAGLQHVVADTVLVRHEGGASFGRGEDRVQLQQSHEDLVNRDFAQYAGSVAHHVSRTREPWQSSVLRASVRVRGMHVRVDARFMGDQRTGTELTAVHTARALARRSEITSLQLVVDDRHHAFFAREVPEVAVVSESDALAAGRLADIVFRPCHVRTEHELVSLASLGRRVCFQQLDFIGYTNPYYYPDADSWHHYRGAIEASYAVADGVAFLSPFVAGEAARLGLRSSGIPSQVVLAGLDHAAAVSTGRWQESPLRAEVGDHFLLVVGASFRHKNRVWALGLFDELRSRGYAGRLVLAGPEPTHGSSRADERERLRSDPALAERVVMLPWLPDDDVADLMSRADAVLYPTTSEGFGLVPFEAARRGTPALSTDAGPLADLISDERARLELTSLSTSADRVMAVLTDDGVRAAVVSALVRDSAELTWDAVAGRLVTLFEQVVSTPARTQGDAVVELLSPASAARWRDSRLRHRVLPRGTRRAAAASVALRRALQVQERLSRPDRGLGRWS